MDTFFEVKKPPDFLAVITAILSQTDNLSPVIIALSGELGAGKTTFVQELAKHLGVTEHVTSPTFTIMKRYELDTEQFDALVHIDAYRFETEAEAVPLRLAEVFTLPRTIICVEWPERISSLLPKSSQELHIDITGNGTRTVQLRT